MVGHFLLTNLLLDKMIQSSPSRIINTIGVGYDITKINFNDFNVEKVEMHRGEAYNRSKLALALFTMELARRVEGLLIFCAVWHLSLNCCTSTHPVDGAGGFSGCPSICKHSLTGLSSTSGWFNMIPY